MEHNILKGLENLGKEAGGLTSGLEEMLNKIKTQLTPEQQKEVEKKLQSTNIDEVLSSIKDASNSMETFMTDK